jgi:hypothetical protein
MRRTLTTAAVIATLGTGTATAGHNHTENTRVKRAICKAFGARCAEAIRVSWCESHWHTTARNGRYLGLFQVSDHWRRTVPGWGPTPLEQARHAHRVFVLTGSTWRHWECKP